MSKMAGLLDCIASEHRDIDKVKADFLRLWAMETLGIERAAVALTANPGGNNSPLDINTVVAAYLVGLTRDYRTARDAWLASIDFMGDFEPDKSESDELELVDSPF